MCECIKQMDDALEAHNGKLSVGFGVTQDMGLVMRLMIGTEKIDKTKRKPVPYVYAAFCPFCGESMTSDKRLPHVVTPSAETGSAT